MPQGEIRGEWYGLFCDGELLSVMRFNRKPLIWDFHVSFMSSNIMEIALLCVCVKEYLEPSA